MKERDEKSGEELWKFLIKEVIRNIKLSTFEDYKFADSKYSSLFYDEK